MSQTIKKVLYKTFGQAAYLKMLHTSFFFLYRTGMLRKNKEYIYYYFAHNFIEKGDCVVDIGANLGYFSKVFSRLVGNTGKVVSVEPVLPFYKTLKWAMRKEQNCTIYNHALGTEQKWIKMSLPKIDNFFRTGLAHVAEANDQATDNFMFDVEMVEGSKLLSKLSRIDYIKCDIEGYERFVLPELKPILEKHKPVLQIETWGEYKDVVFPFLHSIGFESYMLIDGKLIKGDKEGFDGDYIFMHQSKADPIMAKLKAKGVA